MLRLQKLQLLRLEGGLLQRGRGALVKDLQSLTLHPLSRASRLGPKKASHMDTKRIKGGSTRKNLDQQQEMKVARETKEVKVQVIREEKKELGGVAAAVAVALAHQKATKGRTGCLTSTIIITTTTTTITIATNSPLPPH